MDVEYISYNNKKYPIRVGYRAFKKLKEEFPDTKQEEMNRLEDNEPLLWHSLVSGHFAVHGNMDIPLKRDDMEFILDESMGTFLKLVNKFTTEMEENVPAGNRQQRRAEAKGKK